MPNRPTRRTFIKASSATLPAVLVGGALAESVRARAYGAGGDEIRFVLVGCGGRGAGAAAQLMNTRGNVRLVAVADAFPDKATNALKALAEHDAAKVDVPEDRVFSGLDAYRKAIDVDCDLVVLATPPGFRPPHFEYAVAKGRHVFMEKPVATDAPGVRRVLASVEESKKKNLLVAVGLQRRHERRYVETVRRLHDGAVGDVILQRVYWNGGGIWYRDRSPGQSEMGFQVDNWYHFNWICGDQIVEQHIHNLDVACWVKGAWPVECNGMGGGEQRLDGDRTRSQIFDHTFCEYTFEDGTKLYSQGRHLAGSWTQVGERVHGTRGTADPSGWIRSDRGEWRFEGESPGGHQEEQHDVIEALLAGEVYNEGEVGALSTFTAILGREACYSGQVVQWDELLAKGRDLAPGIDDYTLDSTPPTVPGPDGRYPVPVPGRYSPYA